MNNNENGPINFIIYQQNYESSWTFKICLTRRGILLQYKVSYF